MRRRWTVPVLGVAAVLLFGYVATHRDPVQRPDPPAAAPSPPPGLGSLSGERAPGPAGLKVLVSGRFPQIIDTAAGQAVPVPGLRMAAGERVILQPVPAGTVATVTTPRTSRERTVLLPRGDGPAVPLGAEVTVVPALRGTDLYVATRHPGSTSVAVTTATGAVRRTWTEGGRLTPLRDTAAGLVAAQVGDLQGARLRVLDPRTGAERRRLATGGIVVGVGPASIAYVSGSCVSDCPVSVAALDGGATRDFRLPAGSGNPLSGAFSPDGRWLALGVPGQYRNGRLTVIPGFAVVVDLRTGAVEKVPGVSTVAERSADLGWYGDTLVLGVWTQQRGQVGTWTPDRPDEALHVLPAEPAGDPAFASVTVLP